MKELFRVISLLFAAWIAVGCSKYPDGVLDRDEMVSLLVDIHKGEGVVDLQRSVYANDSMKKLLKQSIYAKHGVTAEIVDSSFSWYGNHIEEYLEVYDKVIAELEDEMTRQGANADIHHVYADGDSVDVWKYSPVYRVSGGTPLRQLIFNYTADEGLQKGDSYSLQFKLLNAKKDTRVKSSIFVEYTDGEIELRSNTIAGDGWGRLKLATDSAKTISSLYGAIAFEIDNADVVYLDSVSLVRLRNYPESYSMRGGQRRIRPVKPSTDVKKDTIADGK